MISKTLAGGGLWIEGRLDKPPEGATGPLVFGRDWMLEMLRSEDGRACGFYWAPYAIVRDFPQLDEALMRGCFVGLSKLSGPPAAWLTTSMTFDLGTRPLANSPEELLALIAEPRPYVGIEVIAASPISEKAKRVIASNFEGSLSMQKVASGIGVSHEHLARQFKKDFGLTPVGYRNRLRVAEAMTRLSLNENILETGFESGFNDATRFYSEFRRVTGTSPGKCRQSRS